MSYTTTADKKLDSAKNHIMSAIDDLSEICVKECEGFEDYYPNYKELMYEGLQDLIRVKQRLGNK